MMILRFTWGRCVVALVAILALAVVGGSGRGTSAADGANVAVNPPDTTVSPQGSVDVAIVGTSPSGGSLAVWWLNVKFDPAVVSFEGCTSMPSPPGYWSVSACEVKPPDRDRVVVIGGAATSRVWGDVDCSDGLTPVTAGDARKVILKKIGVEPQQEPGCPKIEDTVSVNGSQRVWGDVDCRAGVSAGDARKVILYKIGVEPEQEPGCPKIEDIVAGGLEGEQTLATITFKGEGADQSCSDLQIEVVAFLGTDAEDLQPMTTDGRICIAQGAVQ